MGKTKQSDYIFVECPKHGLMLFAGRPARFTRGSLGILRCSKCGRRVVEAKK